MGTEHKDHVKKNQLWRLPSGPHCDGVVEEMDTYKHDTEE